MPDISIISASYHSEEWEKILRRSVKEYTTFDYELLIHSNSVNNIGHGKALDRLLEQAKGRIVIAIDIDAHPMVEGWDVAIASRMDEGELSMLAARGGNLKPVRPALMAIRREDAEGKSFVARNHDGVKFDVGIHMYFHLLSEGKNVGYLDCRESRYTDVWGEEYELGGESLVYHNWYGTRWYPAHRIIDGRNYEDFLKAKQSLFRQLPSDIRP
jgi:hypothetical protein